MLSRADAEIVRRDSALPGLAALLDDEVLLASLRAACPSHSIGELEITYVRYRPGATCLVGCRLDVEGSPASLAQRLLESYEAAAGAPVSERVSLAVAIGLFSLAPRCFRYRERYWSERMAALVTQAEELAANVSRKYVA